jgi:arabinogalactan endo-1,4-beta-galactosidase
MKIMTIFSSLIQMSRFRSSISFVILFCISLTSLAQEYSIGTDLSFLKSAEDRGYQFRENGQPKPGLEIFREHGYNWIRLRLFHTPGELPNSLEYTMALAKKAKETGFRFPLDFHYSDTWADPVITVFDRFTRK